MDVVVALLHRDGRWFAQRRSMQARRFPGLWELPGGKVEPGESPEAAIRREIHEELAVTLEVLQAGPTLLHDYGDGIVRLYAFQSEAPEGLRCPLAWGWFSMEALRRLPMPEATLRLLDIR